MALPCYIEVKHYTVTADILSSQIWYNSCYFGKQEKHTEWPLPVSVIFEVGEASFNMILKLTAEKDKADRFLANIMT